MTEHLHPPSTPEVLAWRGLDWVREPRWVDWAVARLLDGWDSPSLRILAGEAPPFDPFEMRQLIDLVLHELDLPYPADPQAAGLQLARELTQQALSEKSTYRRAAIQLEQACIQLGYPAELRQFQDLNCAYDDLFLQGRHD